ncbi:enoyl-CoA hydratase/isomerase family protein [Roseicitreum antarcticum]|uniref:Enoyl-CoA hydratase/carnithine racemase n=1 Tax=Roseicitreum antarcticum TaxID=564137 RepID=A0A1H2RJ53_9RHOB|nr:enoyl-CoA hydratase/isomerase family protein [Roseicitreum antarcticum]SDW18669.1 Enoyl-CoA hydratase/carnithine racemase [Roseicitreum antarcticum]
MIEVGRTGTLWTVTLNRPDKANALTRAALADLLQVLQSAHDHALRALILTGNGPVFSAGADLAEAATGLATDPLWEEVSATLVALPCLTVAALNGTLAGGAFGMALACDTRLAVPSAKFFYPVVARGVMPQPSDPGRMVALIGPARTKLLLLAGQRIDAAQALDWGLIDGIAPPDALMAEALALSTSVQNADPTHLAAIKAMIR